MSKRLTVTLKYSPVPYVHNSSKSLSVSTGGDSIKGHRRLKQVRWDTLDPESTSLFIPNLFIFAQILNCIMSSIIIKTLDLLLLLNTQFRILVARPTMFNILLVIFSTIIKCIFWACVVGLIARPCGEKKIGLCCCVFFSSAHPFCSVCVTGCDPCYTGFWSRGWEI